MAIGARFSTDILTITPCTPDRAVSFLIPRGGDPLGALLGTARTAAWASFVFALRAAAAVQLAVELRELSAGVRFRWDRETSAFMPEGYLADAIENGAGFATHLAHEDMFPELLDHVRRVGEQWRGAEHLARRPGEIYRCLGFARSR